MPTKPDLSDWLDERSERFVAMSDTIWREPQVALRESAACALQIADLRADGFRIQENVGGLPTAFVAEWGSGGPIIGFLGEYDALPNLSQENGPEQQQLVPQGPGHGCGHNMLGTACLASAVVLKSWLEQTGQPGTVRYYGCPAEETITGKVFMARAGVYDDLDAAITWHPNWINSVSKGSSLAVDNLKFRFHGRTAHAAAAPELGRSALDAVELMNIGVNFMREHVIDPVRIHYVITNGGGAPNVVPDEAEVWYFVRAPLRAQVEETTARVRKIAEGAAMMTETTVEEVYMCGAYNTISNLYLSDLALAAMHEIGPIEFTDEERAFAAKIVEGYPAGTRETSLASSHLPLSLLAQPLNGDVHAASDEGRVMSGSTDVGDVSWITPTTMLSTATWALGIPAHSWGITATGAMSIGHKGMLYAAKAMALVGYDLFTEPEHLERAKAEFRAATNGQPYKTPLPEGLSPILPQ
jgi:aminobenzoyl-glutamate utilization protein B